MMEIPKPRALPTSKKTLKFVPENYNCNNCGKEIPVIQYLNHLELAHDIILNREICVHGPIYNDKTAWKRTGDNCLEHNLLTIMNDGRFPGFKQIGGSDNSTDGSKELILSYPNTMYFAHGEDYEEAKFNFAMHLAAKMGFKYVILLGSDEWIVGDIQKTLDELNKRMKDLPEWESQAFHNAIDEHQAQNKWNRFLTESPKLYYCPGLLRTRFTHWLRYSATQVARDGKDVPLATFQRRLLGERTITIHHDDSIREKSRNDLMTKFQDKNVVRERKRVINEAFRRFFEVTFMISERKLADWHKSFFIDAKEPYSHYIIVDEGVKLTRKQVETAHQTLLNHREIDILSAVWKIGKDRSWRICKQIDPEETYLTKRIEEIYTRSKFSKAKDKRYSVLPGDRTVGPVLFINKKVIKEVSQLKDKDKFLQECSMLGFSVTADSNIQISL